MSENSILIDGKEYISSERAAKLVGYTKDYVGQLARAGKIKSKRIGRSWYIEEESINKHKLSVHYVLTKPKKPYVKNNDGENSNKNIVISSNTHIIQKKDIDPVTVHRSFETKKEYHFENEEVDLLPKLREKKHDALLHSDIRYEKVVPSIPTNTKSVTETELRGGREDVKSHSGTFKDVAIRKSLPQKRPPRILRGPFHGVHSSSEKIPQIAQIDGIVIGKKTRNSQKEFSRVTRTSSLIKSGESTEDTGFGRLHYNEYKENTQSTRSSKMIPVIGGIVLFTLFVVVYIIFSLG